jgi:hypothetical protein
MPDRRPRLRRAAYMAAVTTTCGAFVLSLAGIAQTQGQIKPNGDAAAAVKRLQQRAHERCPHHQQQQTTATQRAV